jgi:hypothetical protein
MFLVLGGMLVGDATSETLSAAERSTAVEDAKAASLVLLGFFTMVSLGVWYVFRKRGRIYI